MDQVVQIAGALLILAGFAGAQFGYLKQRSYRYLALNLVGSAILAVLGFIERQWGFFLLEAVWSIVSLVGIVQLARGTETAGAGH